MTNEESEIIQLNVGGTYYTTSKATLCSQESMLKSLFQFPLVYDQQKRIFIDRDGQHFRYILNYLRDSYIDIPSDPIVQNELLREAQYYCLDNLVKFLKIGIDTFISSDEFKFVGKWINPTHGYTYDFKMTLKIKGDYKEEKQTVPIEGYILWSLEKAPENSHILHRIGDYGREFVEGTFHRDKCQMEFHGVRKDVSAEGLIALDQYRITLSEDGQSFEGVTLGNDRLWANIMQGKTEEAIRREAIEEQIKLYHQKNKQRSTC
ncbi:unnamed protein product [Rotaria sp. Silwood1]|nr:unnamed protein product [Rotaria sp. Silwood1]CAF1615037.1 unnamed protein product [Rotaria sp. Silwood1]CAF3733381.1 unnamed protein product [Rotaria sp. Silwood1]CAF4827883.1 unnamed protein product [Rotaria sp. Silwood1]